MAADNNLLADPLDTVHHEMDSMIRDHHVYKSVWSPVIAEQLILEKEPANPNDEFAVAVIKDSHIPRITQRSHGILLCKGALSFVGRRKKGKRLEVLCKYIYNYGSQKTQGLFLLREIGHNSR